MQYKNINIAREIVKFKLTTYYYIPVYGLVNSSKG